MADGAKHQSTISGRPPLPHIIFARGIVRRSLVIAAIVGTILTTINHGDVIMAGGAPVWWKVILTYCVPYCVSTYGAVTARLESYRRQDWA
jgi:hypothetical protein